MEALSCRSRPPILPVVGVSCVVGHGHDNHPLITDDKRDVVGEAGQVYPTPTAFPKSPKQRVLNHGRASILQLVPKSHAKPRDLGLVIAGDALRLSLGFHLAIEPIDGDLDDGILRATDAIFAGELADASLGTLAQPIRPFRPRFPPETKASLPGARASTPPRPNIRAPADAQSATPVLRAHPLNPRATKMTR